MESQISSPRPLPDGWRWVKLGEVSSIISKGTTPTTLGLRYTDTGIPFLRAEDVNGWAIEVDRVTFHISKDADEILSRSRLLPGDFLITIAGTLGRVGYVPPEVPRLNCNQAVAFARLDQSMVDVQYLCFVCSLEYVITPLLDQKAGGVLQNLNLLQIRHLEIPLPPLTEQQRIAGMLKEQMAAVEKARAAAQARLAAVKDLPAAFLRQVFPQPGQPFPDGWRWVRLGEVCKVQGGYAFKSESFAIQGIPIIRISNLVDGQVKLPTDTARIPEHLLSGLDQFLLYKGDVLIAMSGATTGKLGVVESSILPAYLNQRVGRFISETSHLAIVFLYYFLSQPGYLTKIFDNAFGCAIPNVSPGFIESLQIPLPSLSEQRRIAGTLKEQMASVEKARAAAEAELNVINTLPVVLLRRAFNGELR